MTYEEFDLLYQKMIEEELYTGKIKGVEYTLLGDRLDNFKRIGKELNINPKIVLWIYLKKHIDAIVNYVRNDKIISVESIESRIMDARIYLALLRALIEEEKHA